MPSSRRNKAAKGRARGTSIREEEPLFQCGNPSCNLRFSRLPDLNHHRENSTRSCTNYEFIYLAQVPPPPPAAGDGTPAEAPDTLDTGVEGQLRPAADAHPQEGPQNGSNNTQNGESNTHDDNNDFPASGNHSDDDAEEAPSQSSEQENGKPRSVPASRRHADTPNYDLRRRSSRRLNDAEDAPLFSNRETADREFNSFAEQFVFTELP